MIEHVRIVSEWYDFYLQLGGIFWMRRAAAPTGAVSTDNGIVSQRRVPVPGQSGVSTLNRGFWSSRDRLLGRDRGAARSRPHAGRSRL
jgi:hypothetical protein